MTSLMYKLSLFLSLFQQDELTDPQAMGHLT